MSGHDSIWSKLKTLKLKDLTQSQISATIENNFLSESDGLHQGVLVHQAKLAQATFGAAGAIPDSGGISSTDFSDSTVTIIPPVGEVWTLNPALITCTNSGLAPSSITTRITDGTNSVTFPVATIAPGLELPILENNYSSSIRLTSSLYLSVISSISNTQTLNFAYVKEAI